MEIDCFKAYDVRAQVPKKFNEEIAYRIGASLAAFLDAGDRNIVVGRDLRHSGLTLESAFCAGVVATGANVLRLGVCITEEMYCATALSGAVAGAMLTASHNPVSDNGIKMVRAQSHPIAQDTGLKHIRRIAQRRRYKRAPTPGCMRNIDYRRQYIERLLAFVDIKDLKPLRIVCNIGNTSAGATLDLLSDILPFEWVRLNDTADGTFPKGVPNPMLSEHRVETSEAVREYGADMGIAWDGDCDRCFFFDEHGEFVESYYLVGLFSEYFLSRENKQPSTIVHDERLVWHTQETVKRLGGETVRSLAGHSHIKEIMRYTDSVYGGEMSAHHYFRDFFYCDSGMVPWLVLAQLLSQSDQPLSELLRARKMAFPISGEINCVIRGNGERLLDKIEARYGSGAEKVERIDGISVYYPDWRFNVRLSNTEPLVRLNVETRADTALLEQKTAELHSALSS